GCPCCDPVVDHDHAAISDCRCGPTATVALTTALQLDQLALHLFLEPVRRWCDLVDQFLVDDPLGFRPVDHGAQRQLLVTGCANLAYQNQIEGCLETMRDFEGDGHAAARQRQHQRVKVG